MYGLDIFLFVLICFGLLAVNADKIIAWCDKQLAKKH